MPAAGRSDSKYVRKMHYLRYPVPRRGCYQTACGKHIRWGHVTRSRRYVTCKTCRRSLGLPPLEDPR